MRPRDDRGPWSHRGRRDARFARGRRGADRAAARPPARSRPLSGRSRRPASRSLKPPDGAGLWVEGAPDGATVSRLLAAAGTYPDELIRRRDSLEDVFLQLTGPQHGPPAVMHLLAADWVRFGRRRDLRLVVALGAGHPGAHVRDGVQHPHDAAPDRLLPGSAGSRGRSRHAGPDARRVARPTRRRVAGLRVPGQPRQGRRGTSGRWPCWRSTSRSRWSRRSSNGAPSGPST